MTSTTDTFDYAGALDRAADRISRGWCQGVYGDRDGNVCLHGAVGLECGRRIRDSDGSYFEDGDPIKQDRMNKALSYLPLSGIDSGRWNDEPGRKQDEVVQMLRAAAARARTELTQPSGGGTDG